MLQSKFLIQDFLEPNSHRSPIPERLLATFECSGVAKFEVLGVIRDGKRDQKRFVFDLAVVELTADEASETVAPTSDRSESLGEER